MKEADLIDKRKRARSLYAGGMKQGEIARLLKVSRQTVNEWCQMDEDKVAVVGVSGRPTELTEEKRKKLATKLADRPPRRLTRGLDFVRRLLREQEVYEVYSQSHLYRLWRDLAKEGAALPRSPQQGGSRSRRPRYDCEEDSEYRDRQDKILREEGFWKNGPDR